MLSRMIDALVNRVLCAVFDRLSEQVHAADGRGPLQVDVRAELPAPEKTRRAKT